MSSNAPADAVIARMVAQRDLLQALHEQTKAIAVRVTSPDRSVRVEVDAYGGMTGLWLSETAYRNGASALADLIVKTAHTAAEIAADRHKYLNAQFSERWAHSTTA